MSNSLRAWMECLSDPDCPRLIGLFELVNGWRPTLPELAAWARWMSMAEGDALDRAVLRATRDHRPGAA